jgi:hypothetical protein
MVSSVSSERPFSAGGITITCRCNRLKGDIVEALQVVKCAIRTELLVQPAMPCSAVEQAIEESVAAEETMADEVAELIKGDDFL